MLIYFAKRTGASVYNMSAHYSLSHFYELIANKWSQREGWIWAQEIQTKDNWDYENRRPMRRIDYLGYSAKHKKIIAVEIKRTRSDFLNEMKAPEKTAAWLEMAHEFYFAMPSGLLGQAELAAALAKNGLDKKGASVLFVRDYNTKIVIDNTRSIYLSSTAEPTTENQLQVMRQILRRIIWQPQNTTLNPNYFEQINSRPLSGATEGNGE